MAPPSTDSLRAEGVDVGGVEEVEAGFHADVDDLAGFGDVGWRPTR
jgi:hypothetical protein